MQGRALIVVVGLGLIAMLIYVAGIETPEGRPPLPVKAQTGIRGLAQLVPSNTGTLVAFDLRGRLEMPELAASLEEQLQGDPKTAEQWRALGLSPTGLLSGFKPAFALAWLPAEGSDGLLPLEPHPSQPGLTEWEDCAANLMRINRALLDYLREHETFPKSLQELAPTFMHELPTCPAAAGAAYVFENTASNRDYTVMCGGHHHPNALADHPRYTTYERLELGSDADAGDVRGTGGRKAPEPGWLVVVPVHSEATAIQALQALARAIWPGAEPVVEGNRVTVGEGETAVSYALYGGHLFLAHESWALEAGLASAAGEQPRLADDAMFAEALGAVGESAGSLLYVPLQGVLAALDPGTRTDSQTNERLKPLRYLVAHLEVGVDTIEVFADLVLEPSASGVFARDMLNRPSRPLVSAGLVPEGAENYLALDSKYFYDLILSWVALYPNMRGEAMDFDLIFQRQMGFNPITAYFAALPGELAAAQVGETLLLVAPVQNGEALARLLRAVGPSPLKPVGKVGDAVLNQFGAFYEALRPGSTPIGFVAMGSGARPTLESVLKGGSSISGRSLWPVPCSEPGQVLLLAAPLQSVAARMLGEPPPAVARHLKDVQLALSLAVAAHSLQLRARLGGLSLAQIGNLAAQVLSALPGELTRQQRQGLLRCQNNLRSLAEAMDAYANDNQGHYADDLENLAPKYLEELPRCPNTSTTTYRVEVRSDAYEYTMRCNGDNHPSLGANLPQYSSRQGLLPAGEASPEGDVDEP